MKDLKGTKTLENLLAAFAGESQARNKYTFYASKAKKEGYVQISNIFLETAANEKEHEERYRKLAANIRDGKVFEREEKVLWQCSNCGHQLVAEKAPQICPVCKHPQAYFQIKSENY